MFTDYDEQPVVPYTRPEAEKDGADWQEVPFVNYPGAILTGPSILRSNSLMAYPNHISRAWNPSAGQHIERQQKIARLRKLGLLPTNDKRELRRMADLAAQTHKITRLSPISEQIKPFPSPPHGTPSKAP